jgi:hypothetical protein
LSLGSAICLDNATYTAGHDHRAVLPAQLVRLVEQARRN